MENKLPQLTIDRKIIIVLFCVTFSLSLLMHPPAIFMNDEWITLNQLAQLHSGNQLIINEERYGKSFSGDLSGYFTVRENVLGYSILLPLISLPMMWCFLLLGDLSRLIILMLWVICLLIPILLIGPSLFPNNDKKTRILILMGIIMLFLLLLANISLYYPFDMKLPLRPVEIPSIILTQQLLLGGMAPLLYLTMRSIVKDRSYCIAATLISLCCSSYFFWASSAKDHLLVAFLLTCILYSMASYIATKEAKFAFLAFFSSGLIIWARPEIGGFIFLSTLFFYLIYSIGFTDINKNKVFTQFKAPIIGFILGIIPFFLNNKIITNNFLIPPQYLYIDGTYASSFSASLEITDTFNTAVDPATISSTVTFSLLNYVLKIITFLSPNFENLLTNIFGILTITEGKAAGILYLSPFVAPTLILALYWLIKREFPSLHKNMKMFFIFCIILIVGILLAYLRGIHGLNTSLGILPDVRYLSPIYLPLSLICLGIISLFLEDNGKKILVSLIATLLFFSPVCVICLLIVSPYDGGYVGFVTAIGVLIFIGTIITSIFLLLAATGKFSKVYAIISISFLATLPFIWQVFFTFVYSFIRMNGYPFWIPMAEYVYGAFFLPIY